MGNKERARPPLMYGYPGRPFRFSYYEGWTIKEEEGTVSLWRNEEGGAIVISSHINKDPNHKGNAFEHCKRFAEKNSLGPSNVTGNVDVAQAIFNTTEGGICQARFYSRGPRMVMATYNRDKDDVLEQDEAEAILDSMAMPVQ